MRRGEVCRTGERGHKAGFHVVVSRAFITENEDVSTVICAPVYSEILGLATEVEIGMDEGIPHPSAVRCDFLMLMFKVKLTTLVGRLSGAKLQQLADALSRALDLPPRRG